MSKERGYCLVSQQIRNIIDSKSLVTPGFSLDRHKDGINKGRFIDESLEKRVQPSSFDSILGDEVFILDTEETGFFRPNPNETVYRALLQIPRRQRQRRDITDGFVIQPGFTYLIPLQERFKLNKGERIKSSPKSSIGRIFLSAKMISDYNPNRDEINSFYNNGIIQPWLLLQPIAFSSIIYPGISINQLRFFRGLNATLSPSEINDEFDRTPLLYDRDGENNLIPVNPIITEEGLQIDLDLSGRLSSGIIALRARRNPIPIDLKKYGENAKLYAEDYFEPIKNNGNGIELRMGERYLLVSRQALRTPSHLSADLVSYSDRGIEGSLDRAGFIDNGFGDEINEKERKSFGADLVLEVEPHETGFLGRKGEISIPISTLVYFRSSENPDKTYGEMIGSNYQGQVGLRVSKYFKKFDFSRAARDYKKLDRLVLTHDANILTEYKRTKEAFEPIDDETANKLIREIEKKGFLHSRYDCEDDEDVLQVIPYLLLVDSKDRAFTYVRATHIEDYGDERLFGKYSIGIGGHITALDSPEYIKSCLERERKEEVTISGGISTPKLIGTLKAYDKPVDRVHFGLVYASNTNGCIAGNEKSITSLGMNDLNFLKSNLEKFETWSKILIPYLPMISRMTRI